MEDNKLDKVLILCVLILASLALCSYLPEITLMGYELKRIDVLSELRQTESPRDSSASSAKNSDFKSDLSEKTGDTVHLKDDSQTPEAPIINSDPHPSYHPSENVNADRKGRIASENSAKQTSKEGNTSIKEDFELKSVTDPGKNDLLTDFSPQGSMRKRLFQSLDGVKSNRQKFRVAFYGDSFIEGDILCADVRNAFQHEFGGTGVGFVPITSEVSQFRVTIKHKFSGFASFNVLKPVSPGVVFGPGGFCFLPQKNNELEYYANSIYRKGDKLHDIRLFYQSLVDARIRYWFDSNPAINEIGLKPSSGLQQLVIHSGGVDGIHFKFPATDSLRLYGASFEDDHGIYIDNFALRGNSGIPLARISDSMFKDFNQLQRYDLIILQFGLNVAGSEKGELTWYTKPMTDLIQRMKIAHPQAAILVFSVSDRGAKKNGNIQTLESIPDLVDAQREIAKKTGVMFYNLFKAMGGIGSMVTFVANSPSLANKDYTHLNYLGGRKLGNQFFKVFINQYQNCNVHSQNNRAGASLVPDRTTNSGTNSLPPS